MSNITNDILIDFEKDFDLINHPKHYNRSVPGIECVDVAKHFNFCMGNAIKYIWRYQFKKNPIQDLEKAVWYLNKEIESLKEYFEKYKD